MEPNLPEFIGSTNLCTYTGIFVRSMMNWTLIGTYTWSPQIPEFKHSYTTHRYYISFQVIYNWGVWCVQLTQSSAVKSAIER